MNKIEGLFYGHFETGLEGIMPVIAYVDKNYNYKCFNYIEPKDHLIVIKKWRNYSQHYFK